MNHFTAQNPSSAQPLGVPRSSPGRAGAGRIWGGEFSLAGTGSVKSASAIADIDIGTAGAGHGLECRSYLRSIRGSATSEASHA